MLRSADFDRIYRDGHRFTSASFVLFVRSNDTNRPRLGLTVTKKFGSAVVRNRGKRVIREIFRRNRQSFPAGYDVVVNLRAPAATADVARLEQELLRLVARVKDRAQQ